MADNVSFLCKQFLEWRVKGTVVGFMYFLGRTTISKDGHFGAALFSCLW